MSKIRPLIMEQPPLFQYADAPSAAPLYEADKFPEYPALPKFAQDAALYLSRRATYQDGEVGFARVAAALFPNGIHMGNSDAAWARYGILHQIIAKLVRYCNNYNEGGHADSLQDIRVYAAMLQTLDEAIPPVVTGGSV